MPWPLGHTVWSFSTKPAGTPRVSSRFRKTSPCCRCRPHVRSSMQQRTSGNTCARPISPTVYSRATPTFLMPVRPPGASFSTKPAASPPSQRATGQSSVNHNEGWYNAGAGGYAGRDEITSDSTCIYGGPHGPSRPLRRGRIIRQRNALSGLDVRNQPPRSFTVLERSIDRAGRGRGRKFEPLVLGEIQAGGDTVLLIQLRNRFYIGEVQFRGQICPGEHPPILDRGLFEAVQQRLAEQHNGYRAARASREAPLTGRIFDDRGNRMSPSHSRKGGARYGYYVSSALIQGQPQSAGSMARVPAAKIEAVVLDAVRRHIGHDAPIDNTELITTYVRQIEVRRTEIAISLLSEDHASEDEKDNPLVLTVPWSKTPHRRHRDVIAPEGSSRAAARPIRSDTRVKLITAIARGRQWLSEIEAAGRDNRRHRRTGGLQQAPRQHDHLAGLPRAAPRHGRRRRPTATRDRRRPLVRRAGRVVAPAPDARARALTAVFPAAAPDQGSGPWQRQSRSGCDRSCHSRQSLRREPCADLPSHPRTRMLPPA